jgi:hypothetical protein
MDVLLNPSSFERSSAAEHHSLYKAEIPLEPFGILTVTLVVPESKTVEDVFATVETALRVICSKPAEIRAAAAQVVFEGLYPGDQEAFAELLGEGFTVADLEAEMTNPTLFVEGMAQAVRGGVELPEYPHELSFMTDLDDQNVIIVRIDQNGGVIGGYVE